MDTSRYKTLFLNEAKERLAGIEKGLILLEKNPEDAALIESLFRHYHSIKGMCASMGYNNLKDFAHAQEDLLDVFRKKEGSPAKEAVSIMLEASDILREALTGLESDIPVGDLTHAIKKIRDASRPARPMLTHPADGRPVGSPPPLAEGSPEKPMPRGQEIIERPTLIPEKEPPAIRLSHTMKVDGTVFDVLLRVTGDLLSALSSLKEFSAENPSQSGSIRFKNNMYALEKATEELRTNILSARMIPFGDLTETLPRIVRDISKRYSKEVDLNIEGADVTLDRSILEGIGDPLVHIIKNSMDHGIEPKEERVKSGKPEKGSIAVNAALKKDMVVIEVIDDGRGIDLARLREKAIEGGMAKETAAKMSDKEVLMLVCLPGVSLAKTVTDISGRGVGMDIVMSIVASLGGTLDIESFLGKGTAIRISLPRTAAIVKILLVEAASEIFGIPFAKVEKVIRVQGEETLTHQGKSIVVKPLKEIFGMEGAGKTRLTLASHGRPGDSSNGGAVIVSLDDAAGMPFGIGVDDYGEELNAYIRPLRPPFSRLWGVSGWTILGQGRPVFILDAGQIIDSFKDRAS